MKIFKVLFVFIVTIQLISCQSSSQDHANKKIIPAQNLQTAVLDIKGMTCEIGCAKTIESKISKLEGITSAKINFEKEQGTFIYDGTTLSEHSIISSINNLIDGKTYIASLSKKTCKVACKKSCDGKKMDKNCELKEQKDCCLTKK